MRTRSYGGVAGEERKLSPYADFTGGFFAINMALAL